MFRVVFGEDERTGAKVKRNYLLRTFGVIFVVRMLSGCVTSPPLFTVELSDLEARNYFAAREVFEYDETPAVVVSGQSGQHVTVQLRKPNATKILQQQTFYVKRDELKWMIWRGLPPGEYVAELIVRDKTNAVARFVKEPNRDGEK